MCLLLCCVPSIPPVLPGELSLSEFGNTLTHQRFKLRLVCECCGKPQGEGYSVKQPKEWVTQMLPAMKVGCCERDGLFLTVHLLLCCASPALAPGLQPPSHWLPVCRCP